MKTKYEYKIKLCSKCGKELSELQSMQWGYKNKYYCKKHFPLQIFTCIECGKFATLKFRIKSESNINICKSCLNDLVENNMFL